MTSGRWHVTVTAGVLLLVLACASCADATGHNSRHLRAMRARTGAAASEAVQSVKKTVSKVANAVTEAGKSGLDAIGLGVQSTVERLEAMLNGDGSTLSTEPSIGAHLLQGRMKVKFDITSKLPSAYCEMDVQTQRIVTPKLQLSRSGSYNLEFSVFHSSIEYFDMHVKCFENIIVGHIASLDTKFVIKRTTDEQKFQAKDGIGVSLTINYTPASQASSDFTDVTALWRSGMEIYKTDPTKAPEFVKVQYPLARDYWYFLVPGLGAQYYPGYFNGVREVLKQIKLDFEDSKIDTLASVTVNGAKLREEITEFRKKYQNKKVIIIAHSKGGNDVYELMHDGKMDEFVAAVIYEQSPIYGSPLIDNLIGKEANPVLSAAVHVFAGILHAGAAMKELSLTSRTEYMKSRPYKSKVTTVCVTTYKTHFQLGITIVAMEPLFQQLVKHAGYLSDGMVQPMNAIIPNSFAVVYEGADHGSPVLNVPGAPAPCPSEFTWGSLITTWTKMALPPKKAAAATEGTATTQSAPKSQAPKSEHASKTQQAPKSNKF